jgi:hypothetical protein
LKDELDKTHQEAELKNQMAERKQHELMRNRASGTKPKARGKKK